MTPAAYSWTPLIAAHSVAAAGAVGLPITGLFTLLPNRLLGRPLWSDFSGHP